MKRTMIQNAVIVNEGRKVLGSVVIENEKIAEILVGEEKATAPCDEVIDASGCYLLPGAIDEHVHFRDPGLTHKLILPQKAMPLQQEVSLPSWICPIQTRRLRRWRLWKRNSPY